MIKYFVSGMEVSRSDALSHWKKSSTYRNARFRDSIFPNVEGGRRDPVLINHLREAGVEIQGFKDRTDGEIA